VKIPAMQADPCRSTQASTLFPNCGRYVTEVANTIGALQQDLPNQGSAVNGLQNAVNSYQRLGCDTISVAPTAQQEQTCPGNLRTIGTELDLLDKALATVPASTGNQ